MTDHVTWWTPAGWTSGPVPAGALDGTYVTAFQTVSDYPGVFSERFDEVLAVLIHGESETLCTFFVAQKHLPQFVVQCLPALVQAFGPLHAAPPEG